MAGPLLEGVQTGLGISEFIEQRRQFDTTSQLNEQLLALNEKKTQIDEQKRQSAELQAQFKRDTDTVKFYFNSGLKEEIAIPLALAAFNRLVKATGGPLDGPPLKASDFAPGAMKQVVAIMKSLDTYKGDPEDGLAMAATAIAPLVGRTPSEDKAIERAIKNIESQQEALKEGDEIFGTDLYKNATQDAKEEVGIFLRGGGDPGEAMRYLGENADASGSGWIGNDKNISTNDLAFAIESLQAKLDNGTITEEGRERLSILLKTQDRVTTQITSEKAFYRRTAQEEAELDFVIKPEKRGRTLNPETFNSVPKGTTNRQANELGAVLATPKQMDDIATINKVESVAAVVGGLALRAIKAKTASDAFLEGSKLKIAAITKTNALAAAYGDEREAFLGTVSKALAGEAGVLTDRDIKRIKSAFPSFRDTEQIAKFKMAVLNFLIGNAKLAQKQKIFGTFDEKSFRSRTDELFSVLDEGGSKPTTGGLDLSTATDEELSAELNKPN